MAGEHALPWLPLDRLASGLLCSLPLIFITHSHLTHHILYAEIKLTEEVKSLIRSSYDRFTSVTNSLDLQYMEYTRYGARLVKRQSVSPDSLAQLAFQVCVLTRYDSGD